MEIEHDIGRERFVAVVEGAEAVLEYRRIDDHTLDYVRTFVPPELRGRGIATALAERALEYAADQGLRVVPSCWFVGRVIDANPRYGSLVADR